MIAGLIMGQLPGLSLSLILDSEVNLSEESFSLGLSLSVFKVYRKRETCRDLFGLLPWGEY